MKRTRPIFRQPLIGKCVLSLVAVVGFVSTAMAAQFDAPYYVLEKKHGTEWAKEDKAIDAKLAALKKKFGKKPNIIYILVDDLGYADPYCLDDGATPRPHRSDRCHLSG